MPLVEHPFILEQNFSFFFFKLSPSNALCILSKDNMISAESFLSCRVKKGSAGRVNVSMQC